MQVESPKIKRISMEKGIKMLQIFSGTVADSGFCNRTGTAVPYRNIWSF